MLNSILHVADGIISTISMTQIVMHIVRMDCTFILYVKFRPEKSWLPILPFTATKCYSKLVCAHVRGGCEMIFQARIKCFISPLRRSHNCKLFNISLIMFLLGHIYAFNKFKILSLPGMYEPNEWNARFRDTLTVLCTTNENSRFALLQEKSTSPFFRFLNFTRIPLKMVSIQLLDGLKWSSDKTKWPWRAETSL